MSVTDLVARFPNLGLTPFRITSCQTNVYNCIAWAAGITTTKWWPTVWYYYWPSGCPRESTVEAFLIAFSQLGYEKLEDLDPGLTFGIEKVALYTDTNGVPTHMARQLPDGAWTSKLGSLEDITHHNLNALEETSYGYIHCILARKTPE